MAEQRYILMKHDAEGRNHAYLYEYCTIEGTIGTGPHAVDLVRIEQDIASRADFSARYQLDRLYSGLEARCNEVFEDPIRALTKAWEVYQVNAAYFPPKPAAAPKRALPPEYVEKLDK